MWIQHNEIKINPKLQMMMLLSLRFYTYWEQTLKFLLYASKSQITYGFPLLKFYMRWRFSKKMRLLFTRSNLGHSRRECWGGLEILEDLLRSSGSFGHSCREFPNSGLEFLFLEPSSFIPCFTSRTLFMSWIFVFTAWIPWFSGILTFCLFSSLFCSFRHPGS